jgi:hypothetical protein
LQLVVVEVGDPGPDRLVRQPGHAMHRLDAAAADRTRLGCRPHPP